MELKAGEFVVLRYRGRLSQMQAEGLRKSMLGVLPNNKVLVFEDGVDISVLAPRDLKLVA
jgi:hypothetical protein